MGEKSVDEVVHEVDHDFAGMVQKDGFYVVHGESFPAFGVDEEERECRADLLQDSLNILLEGAGEGLGFDRSAMVMKCFGKRDECCRVFFDENRSYRWTPLFCGKHFEHEVELIEADPDGGIRKLFVVGTPWAREAIHVNKFVVRVADVKRNFLQVLLKKVVLYEGLFLAAIG